VWAGGAGAGGWPARAGRGRAGAYVRCRRISKWHRRGTPPPPQAVSKLSIRPPERAASKDVDHAEPINPSMDSCVGQPAAPPCSSLLVPSPPAPPFSSQCAGDGHGRGVVAGEVVDLGENLSGAVDRKTHPSVHAHASLVLGRGPGGTGGSEVLLVPAYRLSFTQQRLGPAGPACLGQLARAQLGLASAARFVRDIVRASPLPVQWGARPRPPARACTTRSASRPSRQACATQPNCATPLPMHDAHTAARGQPRAHLGQGGHRGR
jgi:hypothetical protein